MYGDHYSVVKLFMSNRFMHMVPNVRFIYSRSSSIPHELSITYIRTAILVSHSLFSFYCRYFSSFDTIVLTTRESTLVFIHAWTRLCTSVLSLVVIHFVGQCKLNFSSYVPPCIFARVWYYSSPQSEVSLSIEIGSLLNVRGLITKRCYSRYGIVYNPHINCKCIWMILV